MILSMLIDSLVVYFNFHTHVVAEIVCTEK